MNPGNFKIELDPRLDKHDKIYYLGKVRFPGTIDLSQGLTLLAFVSEDEAEEIQLAVNDKENSSFNKVKKEKAENDLTRLKVRVDSRKDQFGNTFYVGKINYNLIINGFDEIVFLLYTSKVGHEEVQIVGKMIETEMVKRTSSVDKNIEIMRVNHYDPELDGEDLDKDYV